MCSIIELVASVIMLYFWMILIQVVMSWLVVFNVINTQNRFVFMGLAAISVMHREINLVSGRHGSVGII